MDATGSGSAGHRLWRTVLAGTLLALAALKLGGGALGLSPPELRAGDPALDSGALRWAGLLAELVLAGLLLGPRWAWGALGASLFAAVLGIAAVAGELGGVGSESCGCFGPLALGLPARLGVLLGLALLALACLRTGPRRPGS